MRLFGMFGAATLVVATACGGGGDGDGGPGPTPQQTLDRINPSATTLTLAAGSSSSITMTALDTQGGTISNPGTFTFTSRSATVADVTSQGTVFAIGAGSTTIDISLTRAGVTKQATVAVTVTGSLGLTGSVAAGTSSNTFQPQVVVIARTGTVTWSFGSLEHNVIFSGVTGAPANIGNTTNASVSRTFGTAGTFPYDCNLHAGMTGTVVVR